MKYHYLMVPALVLSLLSGCSSQPAEPEAAWQTMQNVSLDAGFDTVITLIEQTDDPDGFNDHFNDLCDSFRYYNSLYDIYNDYEGIANLKTVNDQAGIAPVKVDPQLIELLKKGKAFYELSNGAFDITMGSVLHVWHEYRTEGMAMNEHGESGRVPSEEELKEAASHHGFEYLEIDQENSTVFITDPDVKLDVGGIAKGFATEKTAKMLEQEGVVYSAINAGGNNRTLGPKRDGTTWNVGIQNPDGQGALFVVRINGANSFVTSGDYERFYVGEDGRRYQHIIDPATLYPADRYRSVTIITPDSGDADCLSTALTVLSIEDGEALLEAYQAKTGNSAEAIWILSEDASVDAAHMHKMPGYKIVYTEGLENSLVFN